jgi:hypothetical protein
MITIAQGFQHCAPTLIHLMSQVHRLTAIQQKLMALPRLPREGFRAHSIRSREGCAGDVLVIAAHTQAVATRLKNLAPTLVDALRTHDISEVSIKFQAELLDFADKPPHSPQPIRTLSAHTAEQLQKIAPDSALNDSLKRMVRQAKIV